MPSPKRHAPRGRLKADPMDTGHPMKARCTATNRQGRRCGKSPILGGTVCRMHGGAAPQVQAAAEERLRALVHPAITRLAQLVDQTEFPSVAIAAVKDVLDRVQGKAGESIAIAHSGTVTLEGLLAAAALPPKA
jgi:hypothetical protein